MRTFRVTRKDFQPNWVVISIDYNQTSKSDPLRQTVSTHYRALGTFPRFNQALHFMKKTANEDMVVCEIRQAGEKPGQLSARVYARRVPFGNSPHTVVYQYDREYPY